MGSGAIQRHFRRFRDRPPAGVRFSLLEKPKYWTAICPVRPSHNDGQLHGDFHPFGSPQRQVTLP